MTGPYAVCGDRWYRTIGDSADRDEGWKGMDDAGGVGEFKWFRVVGGGVVDINENAGPTARDACVCT